MSCTDCSHNIPTYYSHSNPLCVGNGGGTSNINASNVIYTGYALTSIGVHTNDSVATSLQEINTAVGTISGIAWNTFNYSCLTGSLVTAQDFVETISAYVCALNTSTNTFINTTYTNAITGIDTRLTNIEGPVLTSCTSVGILSTDSYYQVLTKLITNACNNNTNLTISGANWNSCYTVTPTPTTLTQGFNTLIAQICDIKNNPISTPLPSFDNRGSCISTTGAADTLYNTVVAIRNYACSLPTLDIDSLSWTSCIINPHSGGGADLTSALNAIITAADAAYTKRVITFDPTFFTVTNHSGSCSGLNVTLSGGISDKFVALNGSDTSPNYLLSKMTAGTGINFDTSTTPGTVIIDSTATDSHVKADSADTTTGYLSAKITGITNGDNTASIIQAYNSVTQSLDLTTNINYTNLAGEILSIINGNSELLSTFSTMVCAVDCTSTTTSTTTFGPSVASAIITNLDSVNPIAAKIQFGQSSPTVAWFNSGATSIAASGHITTGNYPVTTSLPVTGTFSIINNNSTAMTYNIYVKDLSGSPVVGSTTGTASLAGSGGTATWSTFSYGTGSVSNYIVHVDLSFT